MKSEQDVISDFNKNVNMTASELETWLKSDDSESAGWPKEDENGETVGHDSGRKIVEILKANPNKDPEKYTGEQMEHMRKVVSYCNRHLAQETKTNKDKAAEEVKKTKSYKSLKNWGHDFLKANDAKNGGGEEEDGEDQDQEAEVDGQEDNDEAEEEGGDEEEAGGKDGDEEKQAGDKRKKAKTDGQTGANKKRVTRQSAAASNGKKQANGKDKDQDAMDEDEDEDGKGGDQEAEEEDDENEEEEEGGEGEEEADEEGNGGDDNKENGSTKKTKKGPQPGDKVSWNWGGGQPKGTVLDVKGEKTTIETKNGNQVSRDGKPDDPAVVLDTGKSKAIKSNHELN